MEMNAGELYRDIINLPRPASDRPRMPREDRAKIFSPFAALRGYGEALKNMEKPRTDKIWHLEEEKERINRELCRLQKGQRITVTFFREDPGPDGFGGIAEGIYETLRGTVQRVDVPFQTLRLEEGNIAFDDIWEICGRDV